MHVKGDLKGRWKLVWKCRKCANISICRLPLVVLSIFTERRDFSALNLSSSRHSLTVKHRYQANISMCVCGTFKIDILLRALKPSPRMTLPPNDCDNMWNTIWQVGLLDLQQQKRSMNYSKTWMFLSTQLLPSAY